MEKLTLLILLVIYLMRELVNYREKQDLMNRLMSKSFSEYKTHEEAGEKNNIDEDTALIDIDDARNDLMEAHE